MEGKINGIVVSANLGNCLPTKAKYTFSLSSESLAKMIHNKIKKVEPDICFLQEVWDYSSIVLGGGYHILGLNDSIGVKKDFAQFVKRTFKSNSIRFKKDVKSKIYPEIGKSTVPSVGKKVSPNSNLVFKDSKTEGKYYTHVEKLQKFPYDGSPESPYGIPADFDVSSAIIKVNETHEKILLGNVHITSAPWNEEQRTYEIQKWIIDDLLPLADEECEGRYIIAGDFNHDEERQKNTSCAKIMKNLVSKYNLNDAAFNNDTIKSSQENTQKRKVTTNLKFPLKNYRYDHIYGSCKFKNYSVEQSLTENDFKKFRRKHYFTWWMHLDHKWISAEFGFSNNKNV